MEENKLIVSKKGIVLIAACVTVLLSGCGVTTSKNVVAESSDMVAMLKEIDTHINANRESIIKTNIIDEFEAETKESEQLLIQLCPTYATMKALGAKQSLTDTRLEMSMRSKEENKQIKILFGDTSLEVVMDKENSYMTKEAFINLMKATQEDYKDTEQSTLLDNVLKDYKWVKAPLSGTERFTLFEVPNGNPNEIFDNVRYSSTESNDTGKIEIYEGYLVTDKIEDIYKQIGLPDEILDKVRISVSVEYHEKENKYYTTQTTTVDGLYDIEVKSKYTFDEDIDIEIPTEDIFDEKTIQQESSEDKSKTVIGELETESETESVYSAKLSKSDKQAIIISTMSSDDTFENYFKDKAKEVNDTVVMLEDFESREPDISEDYGALFYSRHDNGTSSSFNYYMSKTGYQATTYNKYGEIGYVRDNLTSVVERIAEYVGIEVSTDILSECISKVVDIKAQKNVERYTLVLSDKTSNNELKFSLQDAYNSDGKQTITIEADKKCFPNREGAEGVE